MNPIYLDYNATTPLHPDVVDAMLPYLTTHFGNPSSGHVYGVTAKRAVDTARAQVAALLDCDPDEILFTSGGTEANNLAIRGVASLQPDRRHIVTSPVEHPATEQPCAHLEKQSWEVTHVPVDRTGTVAARDVLPVVRGDTVLVTVMLANNETGTIMPIREISDVAHAKGALVHTDAAQAVGKIPTSVRELNVDMLSVAGHKLYAPKGVGALYLRRGTPIQPLLVGAGHERGLRPGTENVASIVGLGKACEIARDDMQSESRRLLVLRDELWNRLQQAVPGLQLNGHPSQRLPNTLNVSFPAVAGSAVLAGAPDVSASTGSACHAHGESPSSVLTAMGLTTREALGAVRLTLGRGTTAEQVRDAASSLVAAFREAADESAAGQRGG